MNEQYLIRQFVDILANALKDADNVDYVFSASEKAHINSAHVGLTQTEINRAEMERCLSERNISLLKDTITSPMHPWVYGFRKSDYSGTIIIANVDMLYLSQKFANDIRAANEILRLIYTVEQD